jgi:hypothetical protein
MKRAALQKSCCLFCAFLWLLALFIHVHITFQIYLNSNHHLRIETVTDNDTRSECIKCMTIFFVRHLPLLLICRSQINHYFILSSIIRTCAAAISVRLIAVSVCAMKHKCTFSRWPQLLSASYSFDLKLLLPLYQILNIYLQLFH